MLHIGTHKTGTTSIQNFLGTQEGYLKANGFSFCGGLKGKPNFKELFHGAVNPGRHEDMVVRPPKAPAVILRWRTRRAIKRALQRSDGHTVIVSTELLSFLRHEEEIARLRALFPTGTTFTVIVFLRPRKDFLASYKRQLDAQKTRYGTRQGMTTYVEDDSWLADYEALLSTFKVLTDDVRAIDYAEAMQNKSNIIEALCSTLGVPPPADLSSLPYLNRRASTDATPAV